MAELSSCNRDLRPHKIKLWLSSASLEKFSDPWFSVLSSGTGQRRDLEKIEMFPKTPL